MKFEEFEILVDLLKKSYDECKRFNKALGDVCGEDSSIWYYKQYDIVSENFIKILKLNGESDDGADWFVYEGLEQIENGGTEIGVEDKKYSIKNIHDYYDYLMELNKTKA